MKDMWKEFKEFINKGDIVMIAVALVMALYFKPIIDQVIAGVITPIIAAIFGESTYESIGFDIGDAFISIGLVIDAIDRLRRRRRRPVLHRQGLQPLEAVRGRGGRPDRDRVADRHPRLAASALIADAPHASTECCCRRRCGARHRRCGDDGEQVSPTLLDVPETVAIGVLPDPPTDAPTLPSPPPPPTTAPPPTDAHRRPRTSRSRHRSATSSPATECC